MVRCEANALGWSMSSRGLPAPARAGVPAIHGAACWA